MIVKTLALFLVFVFLLSGCAVVGGSSPLSDLSKFARDDVSQALTLANAATDAGAQYRARCYATLLKSVPEPSPAAPAPEVKGVVSGFEVAAELAAKVRSTAGAGLVSEAVQADCAYVVDEVRRFVLRNGAQALPGGGLVGGFLFK